MSDIYCKLPNDMKLRYAEKISVINNYDPYTFTKNNFLTDVKDFPTVTLIDISTYLVHSHNPYCSDQQLKAFKSLDGYKYYEAGFIRSMNFVKVGENFVVLADIMHSQRMNEKLLKAWVIVLSNGSISSAHCTCMAGLGECCSHTAAIAFALHVGTSDEELSCTDKLSTWTMPKTKLNVVAKKINDIDWGTKSTSYDDIYLQKVDPLGGQYLETFFKKLELAEPEASILSIVEPFASARISTTEKNLPPLLTELYNECYKDLPLDDLRNISVDFSVTDDQINSIAVFETVKQAGKKSWFDLRAGRITASNFKSACCSSLEKPSISLLKNLCYPVKITKQIPSIKWGVDHEKIALHQYTDNMIPRHRNLTVFLNGLIISMENPMLAASPDALVQCDCCGPGCVEVKCPFTLKDPAMNFEDLVNMKDPFILKNEEDEFFLNPSHKYYYQVQLQMYCAETQYCDFVVWSKRRTVLLRTEIDTDFLSHNILRAKNFHKNIVVPELLARYFTSPKESILELVPEPDENNS